MPFPNGVSSVSTMSGVPAAVITPCLKELLEEGSKKQPKPSAAEGAGHDEGWFGLAAGKVLNAEEMLDYKRRHRATENY